MTVETVKFGKGFRPIKSRGRKITTLAGALRKVTQLEHMLEVAMASKANSVELFDECVRLKAENANLRSCIENPAPVPLRLECPKCGELHIDEGEFAEKVHHTHACQGCGHAWRPAVVATVGVRFLPGFKNETPADRYNKLTSEVLAGKLSVSAARKLFGMPELPEDDG